ncbi:MAG: PQQ-like beta-propeller repeat protein [Bacteroidales bacterium]|nr:PQQ-like beta-propeller repeat protein [Bacteroidales bacterium]
MIFSYKNGFVLMIVCYCFTITGCHKETDDTDDNLPEKADTLCVEKGAGLWGYPETSMFVYHTSETILYNYSLKIGHSNLVVLLDGESVPDSGWFVMDRSHHLSANCENKVIWRLGLEKQVYYGCPVVDDDGTIYISTGIFRWTDWGGLYAVNPDGTVKWSYDCEYNPYSPVIGQNGLIFIQDFHNTVYAISGMGELKWKFNDFDNEIIVFYDMGQRIPAVGSDGTVYIASDGLYALNPGNGERLWRFNPLPGKSCRQSPVIGQEGTIYIFIHQDDFYAVNPDGTEKWHAKLDHEDEMTFSCPAIDSEGVLYIPAEQRSNGFVYAFNPDGTKKWKYVVEGSGRTVRSSPVFGTDGTIYITTKSGGYDTPSKLIALSPSGCKIWEFIVETFHGVNAADDIYATPSVGADGMIYFGSENEHFYCIHPDGTLNWKIQIAHSINWSSAAIIHDGTLYVGTHLEDPQYKGNLYAIRTTSLGYASSLWPRFRQNNKNDGRYPDR